MVLGVCYTCTCTHLRHVMRLGIEMPDMYRSAAAAFASIFFVSVIIYVYLMSTRSELVYLYGGPIHIGHSILIIC